MIQKVPYCSENWLCFPFPPSYWVRETYINCICRDEHGFVWPTKVIKIFYHVRILFYSRILIIPDFSIRFLISSLLSWKFYDSDFRFEFPPFNKANMSNIISMLTITHLSYHYVPSSFLSSQLTMGYAHIQCKASRIDSQLSLIRMLVTLNFFINCFLLCILNTSHYFFFLSHLFVSFSHFLTFRFMPSC